MKPALGGEYVSATSLATLKNGTNFTPIVWVRDSVKRFSHFVRQVCGPGRGFITENGLRKRDIERPQRTAISYYRDANLDGSEDAVRAVTMHQMAGTVTPFTVPAGSCSYLRISCQAGISSRAGSEMRQQLLANWRPGEPFR